MSQLSSEISSLLHKYSWQSYKLRPPKEKNEPVGGEKNDRIIIKIEIKNIQIKTVLITIYKNMLSNLKQLELWTNFSLKIFYL